MLARWITLNKGLMLHPKDDFYLPGYAEAVFEKAFEYITNRYSEQHRKYHNFSHIYSCLSFYDQVKTYLGNPLEVEMGLWLHDLIYNPARQDNEERSASFVNSLDWLKPSSAEMIKHLILKTKHISSEIYPEGDTAYLLDIDLTILGSALDVYQNYTKAIRLEYSFVPQEDYCSGRIKVLQSLLDSNPEIYHTDYFKERYTNRALVNIRSELNQLNLGIIL